MDYEQIDLMDYQGTDSKLIITSQSIPVGTYKNLILHISTESNVNFVVDEDGTQALKQPSNKLQLGSFTVSDEATSLSGTVDPTLFDEGTCSLSTGKYVYLYQGSVATSTLGDLVDESDSEFNTVVPDGVVSPYSSTEVADDGSYAFGYLPEGDYTVAFNCDGDDDSSIQYDGLTIPNPDGQVAEVTLTVGTTSTVNFTPVL